MTFTGRDGDFQHGVDKGYGDFRRLLGCPFRGPFEVQGNTPMRQIFQQNCLSKVVNIALHQPSQLKINNF